MFVNNIGSIYTEFSDFLYYFDMKIKSINSEDLKKLHRPLRKLKECLENKILTEVYQKSDKTRFLKFFNNLQAYLLDEITEGEFNEFSKKEHFELFRIPEGLGGYFDDSKNTIVFLLDSRTLELIKEAKDEEIYDLANYVWTAFVHEDTHFQQQNFVNNSMEKKGLKPLKISKSYVKYDSSLPYDLSIERNIQYFSNQFEVDALAREIGEKLKTLYQVENSSLTEAQLHRLVQSIFKDIKNDNLPKSKKVDRNEIQKVVSIYWDPRISKKVKLKFFGTLFEYLYNEEN